MCMDCNFTALLEDDEESNMSCCTNISTDSSEEMLMDRNLSLIVRLIFMGADALSLICLLLPYMLTDKVKGTMLGKLMKSYCILSLLTLLIEVPYALMVFVIPGTNVACSVLIYLACLTLLAALISKVLFLFHVGYLFYCSYKMVPKDTTEYQIVRLKVGYILAIAITPIVMILIIVVHNHVIHDVKFVGEDRCLHGEELSRFTVNTVIAFVVCIHCLGVLIIIVLVFLLRKAYQTQKAVGQDTKNLFRIALCIVVAFGMAWIVYAFQPLYQPVARLVFYSISTIENIIVITVLFYNNQMLMKIKMYIMNLKCNHKTVGTNDVV